MQKTKNIKIDNVEYEIQELLAIERTLMAFKISKILSDFGSFDDNKTEAFVDILNKLDPEYGAKLITTILQKGIRFPKVETENQFNIHFTQYYSHQIQLVADILSFNFSDTISNIKKKLTSIGAITPISGDLQSQGKGKN